MQFLYSSSCKYFNNDIKSQLEYKVNKKKVNKKAIKANKNALNLIKANKNALNLMENEKYLF